MSRTEPKRKGAPAPEWLALEAAARHTGRSVATIKRLVSQGLAAKRLVPRPGKRPEAQVSLADLKRHFDSPVHVPATVSQPEPMTRTWSRYEPMEVINASEPVSGGNGLERLVELLSAAAAPEVAVRDKLTWSLREARAMTGLSLPALRELVEEHEELTIRRGRRVWVKAVGLRRVLS